MATKGIVSGVIANMVTLKVDGPVAQNEICFIETGGDKLMAEVTQIIFIPAPRNFYRALVRCISSMNALPGTLINTVSVLPNS